MIGIAKTGSGKTWAFLLPMFRHILDQPALEETDAPIAVIMSPTRELCLQIGKECKKFVKSLKIRVVTVYGGAGINRWTETRYWNMLQVIMKSGYDCKKKL